MTGNQKQNYLVVPYYKGLGESLKKLGKNMKYKYTSKEEIPSKASWWLPREKSSNEKEWSHL